MPYLISIARTYRSRPINQLVNELIERAEPPSKNYRQYLGASAIGAECLRKVQYDWMCDPVFPARIKDIFARGHFFEDVTRRHLIAAGFKFAPAERLEFKAADGLFRGHADGDHRRRTGAAGADLSVSMGTQMPQGQRLERDRARRLGRALCDLCRPGRDLPGLFGS